jgi:MEKHLA domain
MIEPIATLAHYNTTVLYKFWRLEASTLSDIWADPAIIQWTQILLDSYRRLIGTDLIERDRSPIAQSQILFCAPFVVVAHDTQADSQLNYGNQTALDLWELDWSSFISTRSKDTAEPVNQAVRQQMLAQVQSQGFIQNYQGVRISSSGKRFNIAQATIWNLTDTAGKPCGQAATFGNWQYLAPHDR